MTRREGWALVLGLGLTLAVRPVYLALAPLPVRSDASGYDAAARWLVATGSYAFPVGGDLWVEDVFREDAWPAFLERPANAWAMPGYLGFVAGLYRVFGTGPERHRGPTRRACRPGDLARLQVARARMLGQALTTPFTFPGPPVPVRSWSFAMQSAILALALVGWWRRRADAPALLVLCGVFGLQVLAYWSVSNLWSRYLYPLMPLVLVLAAGGATALAAPGTPSTDAAGEPSPRPKGTVRSRR